MDLNKSFNNLLNFDFKEFNWRGFYRKNQKLIVRSGLGFFLTLFFVYIIFFIAPSDFPVNQVISIEKGSSLEEIVSLLDEEKIVKYPSLFKFFFFISGNQKDLVAGDYFFSRKLNLFSVLSRISKGERGIYPTRITFPEGVTIVEIGKILKQNFEDFDEEEFIRLAKDKEGFLFPDTYKFLPSVGPRQVIFTMGATFEEKIEPLLPEIEESGYSLEEIIIMASLLEEEARTRKTREMISGILWKRIEIGMALQVDAVFPYIIGKNTFELTLEDLDIESPYNTYRYRGLPPGAISNPGLNSIESALRPTESDFLFYLSDRHGRTHYAKNFEAHKRNKRVYLY